MELEIVFMKHSVPNHKLFDKVNIIIILHQAIYCPSSISWSNLKLLAVIVFKISL